MPFSPQSIEHTESRINTMRLQAAAPELLEALKRSAESLLIASETFGSEKLLSDCMYARKAIAKATGE